MLPDKLKTYYELLLKWQKAVNLVGLSTIKDAQDRHFNDSLQIEHLIPATATTLYDLGSGAGFPGLVLAIQCPFLNVTLIESDHKKCTFLSTVSHETKTPVTVLAMRIEEAVRTLPAPDVVTARALAPLDELCAMIWPLAQRNPDLIAIFLKGARADAEITEAQQKWTFTLENYPSKTDAAARILVIKNLDRLPDSRA